MEYILYLIFLPVLYLNYKIVISDVKEKKIPNKYLLYLLFLVPIYYILVFWFDLEILNINSNATVLNFFSQLIFILCMSFLLFYYWVWSAWDAKYIIVLSLFIINIWVLAFLTNIWILAVIYLFLYFIYFYSIKNIFNHKYRKSLFWDIYMQAKEKVILFLEDPVNWYDKRIIFKKIFKWIVTFLILFVSFRLLRIYIYSSLLSSWNGKSTWRIWFIVNYLKDYNINVIILWIFIFLLSFYLIKKIIRIINAKFVKKFKDYLLNHKWINPEIVDFVFIFILTIWLITFIIYEYKTNPYAISNHLKLIFGYYVIFMIIVRLIMYSYHITFQLWEQDYINISKLKEWLIIDKSFLIKLFWSQKVLWASENKEGILYPSPEVYFNSINNPIDKETVEKIKDIYIIVNKYHIKGKTVWYSEMDSIKTLKTFAFWIYIFYAFIITIFLWDSLFKGFIWLLWRLVEKMLLP